MVGWEWKYKKIYKRESMVELSISINDLKSSYGIKVQFIELIIAVKAIAARHIVSRIPSIKFRIF